ncbi:MAG: tetratricopeptide repeat protein [Planctomycetota bacterium]|jgi:hypothetical protein
MDEKQGEKKPIVSSKSFMTVGPTLHYSHQNVQRCRLLALVSFVLSCCFWSKIVTGSFWSFNLQSIFSAELWFLERSISTGVSIFEYPWQILVLGLLMGVLSMTPVLISQLMSFSYSIPFLLSVFFIADLPILSLSLLISCIGSACRPLRFRSRFTAIILCTTPQLLYWGFFGGVRGADPVEWGFSFAPWICAWMIGLCIAGLVLGIGHYTRYRPGLVWIFTSVFLFLSLLTFEIRIGFDELDYQLYVAKNDPEQVTEFHDHSIAQLLDDFVTDPSVRVYIGYFAPNEPIPLRAEVKQALQFKLQQGRWPIWPNFKIPPELDYQAKRAQLLMNYDIFIERRPTSRRMPIALYYKALLTDYKPDLNKLGREEILHFYNDYPLDYDDSAVEVSRKTMWSLYSDESFKTWWSLYSNKVFSESPESIEARWRIAKHVSGQIGEFELADSHLFEAEKMAIERLKMLEEQQTAGDTIFSLFHSPSESVMTTVKLTDLLRRLHHLRDIIGPQNRTDDPASRKRLSMFVALDPHALDYAEMLDKLLKETEQTDPLRDNILLAQAKLVADRQLRAERFDQLHEQFPKSDGGTQALYELGLLKLIQYQDESDPGQKKALLVEARKTLERFLEKYPEHFSAEPVRKNLKDLPSSE